MSPRRHRMCLLNPNSMTEMRWKCTVAYDGTDFLGWQTQPGGDTVQALIEQRVAALFGQPVTIFGAGRTDAGVHARGQVFHFDADWQHGPEKLLRAMRPGLPETIQVYAAAPVADDFHARFSATRKVYSYQFMEGRASPFDYRYCWSLESYRLDIDAMTRAAAFLLGTHDFAAFAANPAEDRLGDTIRTLYELGIARAGPRVSLRVVGNGFLYKMVRSLAGCLFDVGRGALSPDAIPSILAARKRTHIVRSAPAQGLCLDSVAYDFDEV